MRPGFVQLRRLGRVKELLEGRASQAEIASELKAAPFAVKKMAEQSRRFGLGELERALWNYHSSISKSAMAAGSLKSWKKY